MEATPTRITWRRRFTAPFVPAVGQCCLSGEIRTVCLGAFAFGNVGSGLETGSDYLWLNELHVDHPFRRRGLASRMLEFVRDWADETGISYMACVTGMKNMPAQALYEANGFDLSPVMWVDTRV
jgi:GNAT superfamily N-acetyltransferase